MPYPSDREVDRPWVMRTYAGHSSTVASNALFRRNLAKGQTGLSVAFDLPTQTGYDPDAELAAGEVGRVGVPVAHLDEMRRLFDGIDLASANTSMTINATAMWLLALYIVTAQEQAEAAGQDPDSVLARLAGTTQTTSSRSTCPGAPTCSRPGPASGWPPAGLRPVSWTVRHLPKWNPINICSYHLQEAGAGPVQEIAFALCTAMAVLNAVFDQETLPEKQRGEVVARVSFFVNAGVRFVEELCKIRAFASLWDEITRERYGITDARQRRFRYGVQVNSLGLTEIQPENNVQRIVLEMLAVTLSRDARARAVQLPAWNEALGLPRAWDQQWALRMQQVLAYETDLLEYEDIFAGSAVIESKTGEIASAARVEIQRVLDMGGAVAAVENGYMKTELVRAQSGRRRRLESGAAALVGVNRFTTTEPSPLQNSDTLVTEKIDPEVESEAAAEVRRWRADRDDVAVKAGLDALRQAAVGGENLMEATLACARSGVTTGEWAGVLRRVFGEYRAPTGVAAAAGGEAGDLTRVRRQVRLTGEELGERLRLLIGKPGLDGHSNGAGQVAVRAREAGFEVIYQGIRLSPAQIVAAAVQEDVHAVGLSILSGSHLSLVPAAAEGLRQAGAGDVPVIVGGIVPADDEAVLLRNGAARVFTPKDYSLTEILAGIVDTVRIARGLGSLRHC